MKRVSAADVTIKTDLVAPIEAGLCVLVEGVEENCTVIENKLGILCVSQPFLFAIVEGNKLEYPEAMPDEASAAFFESFVATLETLHGSGKVKASDYGEYMEVHVENDGAVMP